jgi:hypothetical protein
MEKCAHLGIKMAPNFMAHSPRILQDYAYVNELIDSNTLWWRANLPREIFVRWK